MKKVYITTAIDYVNAAPHLGHALEKIQADVLARHHRAMGDEVFFLSGTDENSLKNVRSAEKLGMPVSELVDKNYQKFYAMKDALNLSFDDFIRTTEKRHIVGAQKLWASCAKDIYKKKYSGLYCVGCEEFYKEDELTDGGFCPEHGTAPELVEEENYFFRLTNYANKIKKLIEIDELKIIPEARKKEILNFINSGLQDFCISRSAERAKGWGIDVPGDPTQKIWVWFDALINYITALGYGSSDESKFNEFWQGDGARLHVIGKGITRFHAIYWPAMLLSAGLNLPKAIFSHGYITVNGQKMSKSIGNVIDPFELAEKYGVDGTRYFLLREVPAMGDGDFSYEKMEKRYNSDLASGLGNLFSRTIAMVGQAGFKDFKAAPNEYTEKEVNDVCKKYTDNFINFNETLSEIWSLVASCDKYIDEQKPWAIADKAKQEEVFGNLLYSLKNIAELLVPFLPETSEKILKGLNERNGTYNIVKTEPLFPRLK
ncbi:MAG: methionine--tRNA ligase [Candidatus Pacebacteria bacterium]|nr:methionine--tRNA ligase [Candidatus Paceibacterota bacterium]